MFQLPSEVVAFVAAACRAGIADTWNRIVARAWEKSADFRLKTEARRRQTTEAMAPRAGTDRNFLYEDLFGLPEIPHALSERIFFAGLGDSTSAKNDPRSEYVLPQELDLVSWPLTYLFLKEILGMERYAYRDDSLCRRPLSRTYQNL